MIIPTPTRFFLVAGASGGFTQLNAFDGALMASGIGDTNLVKMSSILPPGCSPIKGRPHSLLPGSLVPVAYASLMSSQPGEIISSAVAIGIPEDDEQAGLIMEYSAFARKSVVTAKVIKMVEEGMRLRKRKILKIVVADASLVVKTHGATFAGVVLFD